MNFSTGSISDLAGNGFVRYAEHPDSIAAERFASLSLPHYWRIDYNIVKPHSSLGGLPPSVFANRPLQKGQIEAGPTLLTGRKLGSTSPSPTAHPFRRLAYQYPYCPSSMIPRRKLRGTQRLAA
jgi:hypothetical protein